MKYRYTVTNATTGKTETVELDPCAPDAQARLAAAMLRAKGTSPARVVTVKAEPAGGPVHIRESLKAAAAAIDAARARKAAP